MARFYGKFKETPLGQLASFGFTLWLFWSGTFWRILSFVIPVLLLANFLAPALIDGWIRNAAAEAQRAAAQQQQGGGFGAGMGGQGGRGPTGFGAPPSGRRDFGAAGEVVDVDAKIKDN